MHPRSSLMAARGGRRDQPGSEVTVEPHSSVTMAHTSRCLVDRSYVERKPLFTEGHHQSILKSRRRPETFHQKGAGSGGPRNLQNQNQNPGLSLSDLCPPGSARSAPEPPARPREPLLRRAAQPSLPGSVLQVQRVNPPLRPQLTSTVLHPTYTPPSRRHGPDHARWTHGHAPSTQGHAPSTLSHAPSTPREGTRPASSEQNPGRSCQADYWACAIPEAPPPSADRKSAGWSPRREYEALLDYTYPLRPGCSHPNMKDSGIGLDHWGSSASLSGAEPSEWAELSSPDLFPLRAHAPPCSTPHQSTPISASRDSLDRSRDGAGEDVRRRAAASAFIRSTSVLPRCSRAGEETDEEFWPLPEQLEELQQLSRQVREATIRCGSLDRDSASVPSSASGVLEHTLEAVEDRLFGCEAAGGDGDLEIAGSHAGEGGRSLTGIREGQPCGSAPDQSDSLMKRIQVFCSHLELLIQRLYALSQIMEKMAAPAGGGVSIKSSLADYQSLQKQVSSQQPLTACVLHAGRHLLRCIDGTSPFLRDTLLLVERQSGALQAHSDHILSVDSLTLSR